MISKRMAKRKKDSAVSPIIATILLVAITVVLAAVLYVMVSGFTHAPAASNSAGLNEVQSGDSWTVTVSSVSASNIPISNLKIVITGASGPNLNGTFSYAASNPWTKSPSTAVVDVNFTAAASGSTTYLAAGDSFSIAYSGTGLTGGASTFASDMIGATITLYSGNTVLGSVTL